MLPHCGFFVRYFSFETYKTGGHLTPGDRSFAYTLFLFINQDGTGRRIVVNGPRLAKAHGPPTQTRETCRSVCPILANFNSTASFPKATIAIKISLHLRVD